jgi:phage shock protein E
MNWLGKLMGMGSAAPEADFPRDAVLVDVRSPSEFAGGHVEGAINLPLERVAAAIATAVPDKSTAIVVYCASGMRSGVARRSLLQLGYQQVVNGGGAGAVALKTGLPIVRG